MVAILCTFAKHLSETTFIREMILFCIVIIGILYHDDCCVKQKTSIKTINSFLVMELQNIFKLQFFEVFVDLVRFEKRFAIIFNIPDLEYHIICTLTKRELL